MAAPRPLIILGALVVQNAAESLLLRWSRGVLKHDFSAAALVFVSEVMKLAVCAAVVLHRSDGSATVGSLTRLVFSGYGWIPAVLYAVQNVCRIMALTYLPAATYLVASQAKVVFAALFAMVLLGRQLGGIRWRAVFELAIGLAVLSWPGCEARDEQHNRDAFLGAVAVTAMVTLSGFNGALVELLLKRRPSMWETNVQLAAWGALVSMLSILSPERPGELPLASALSRLGALEYLTAFVSSVGGLLVAAVVRELSNVAKCYAVSLAFVLATAVGAAFFGDHLSTIFLLGSGVVLIAVMNYALAPEERAAPASATAPAPPSLAVCPDPPGKTGAHRV